MKMLIRNILLGLILFLPHLRNGPYIDNTDIANTIFALWAKRCD